MLEIAVTDDERQALEGWAREAGKKPADLASEWIAQKLDAQVPASAPPDEVPEMHF